MTPRVGQVMTRTLVTTSPDTRVGDARRLAAEEGLRHLLVVEPGGLVGVLSVCDLADADEEARVARLVTEPAITVAATATLEEAARLMRENGVGCLPVLAGNLVVGVVSRGDLRHSGLPVPEVGAVPELGCGD